MMRHITEDGIRLIKGFESFSPVPYRCPAGIWTIGYGHTGPEVHEDTPAITIEQGEELLKADLLRFEQAVLRLITRPLTDGQGGFKDEAQSLSVIARHITGTRWSGPAFFGLKRVSSKKRERLGLVIHVSLPVRLSLF